MQSKNFFFPIFLTFLFLALIIFFLSTRTTLFRGGIFQNIFFGIQGGVFKVVTLPGNFFQNKDLTNLQQENLSLKEQLVKMQKLQEDNAALQDQFQTTEISSSNLLPAQVIGDPQFIPGISNSETLVINKGKMDGVRIGDTIIYKTNVVGSISQVADNASLVTLVSNKAMSFTVKTQNTQAQGVLIGQGNGIMVMGNVVLSDALKVGDIVVTNGSQDISGKGLAPNLVVGKIISVSKNPSSLYQSASVQSLLQFNKLIMVFILK